MTRKTLFLALILLLSVACQFAPRRASAYTDGDWTPTNNAQWWWKYVIPFGPSPQPWKKAVRVSNVFVDKEIVNARTQEAANPVTFTFTNTAPQPMSCDGSILLTHTVLDKNGSVLSTEVLARIKVPAALKSGEAFIVRTTTITIEKYWGYTQGLTVEYR